MKTKKSLFGAPLNLKVESVEFVCAVCKRTRKTVDCWVSFSVCQTHTHTHTRHVDGQNMETHSNAHMGTDTHVHTQLYALGHRQACPDLHLPTHICLMWKLLLCHITGNEPVHMSPVSFKVRELDKQRARELHCSIIAALLRLCYFFFYFKYLVKYMVWGLQEMKYKCPKQNTFQKHLYQS